MEPAPYRHNTDTKLEILHVENDLEALELEILQLKFKLESLQLVREKNRTKLQERRKCLVISDRFSPDSQGRPVPLLPGEEPVIPEGRGVSP